MTKLEKIERDVEALGSEELARFRQWFAAFDAADWDRRLEEDAASGRLDNLAEQALSAHHAKRTRAL